MAIEHLAPSAVKSDPDKWHDNDGENGVRSQKREVERAHAASSGKAGDSVVCVVPDVTNKEKRRGCDC